MLTCLVYDYIFEIAPLDDSLFEDPCLALIEWKMWGFFLPPFNELDESLALIEHLDSDGGALAYLIEYVNEGIHFLVVGDIKFHDLLQIRERLLRPILLILILDEQLLDQSALVILHLLEEGLLQTYIQVTKQHQREFIILE
jgi:hypothetical protein